MGVSLEPPTRHKITLSLRTGKKRALSNLDQLIELVKITYGKKIEVVIVQREKLSAYQQLEMIRTTVHLTPPGKVGQMTLAV
jgi:hypothetical protein